MVRIAEKVIRAKSSSSCQTQFLFRVADGTGLDGFADSSFDMVTSVFGVFLIPNRAAALREIRRVLKRDAVFATTAWTTTEHNEALREAGFGANLQDSMALMKVMPRGTSPDERRPQPMPQFVLDWFDRDKIRETLTEDGRFRNVQVYRSIHSVAFGGVGDMWNAFVSSSPHGAAMISGEDPEQAALARAAFGRYVAVDGDQDGTVFVQAAANIVLAS
jgi:ubiquinone/menaquinone biosynthesis C-methylase UbiE